MFKFLFGKKGGKAVIETQRETVARSVDALNVVFAGMADKPKIGVDLNSGMLTVDLPDQMPDEALALPAPEEKPVVEETTETREETADTPQKVVEAAGGEKATA